MFSNEDYLAELLAEAGMVSADELANTRNALPSGESIIEYFMAQGSLTQEDVAKTLAINAGIPFVRLADVVFKQGIDTLVSSEIAKRYRVIPMKV